MTAAVIEHWSNPELGPTEAGRFPTLSWLLLATMVALTIQMAIRVPAIIASGIGIPAGPAAVSSTPDAPDFDLPEPGEIEPGAGPADAPTAPMAPAGAARPAASPDAPTSVEVLDSLAAELRRTQSALVERERSIAVREAVVQAVETRVREQVARLQQLKGELAQLLGAVSADQQARIAQLIKVYEAMKAKSAAAIFDPMTLDLLLPIVRGMRETKVAAIVAEMDPAKARALTAELARARPLPTSP